MQYKVSFIDVNGDEFMGTTEHFTTDGRYNLNTITDIALDTAKKSLKSAYITGFNIRKNSFNAPVLTTINI